MRLIKTAVWLGLALFCAFAFHDRYWRWRGCFNELGRCYDSDEGVMVEQAGLLWGGLALLFMVGFLGSFRRRQRGRPPQAPSKT
jgi:hypothetical protein